MLKSHIQTGTDYAFREKRLPGAPLARVRIIAHVRGNKWKAERLEPNPGLVGYVESGQLICPWKEQKAFLKEEANAQRLRDDNHRHNYEADSAVDNAVQQVFESTGEPVDYRHGSLIGRPQAIARIRQRAGVKGRHSSAAYTDRAGMFHLPFEEALDVARCFAAAEPATVLVEAEATERDWSSRATRPGEDHIIPLLNKYRASWAILRQWAGYDAAIAQREETIKKLERLVWDAIYALQSGKLDREASRLRRVLERG